MWAAVEYAEVAEKVQTASMIVRKSRVDIEICFMGGGGGTNDAEEVTGTINYSSHSSMLSISSFCSL